jgi:hypothetical protein
MGIKDAEFYIDSINIGFMGIKDAEFYINSKNINLYL